jgi:predicted oxidoreductase
MLCRQYYPTTEARKRHLEKVIDHIRTDLEAKTLNKVVADWVSHCDRYRRKMIGSGSQFQRFHPRSAAPVVAGWR